MTKIAYVEKNFRPATLAIIQRADEIITKYDGYGIKLTLRGIYYQFVAMGEDAMEAFEFPYDKEVGSRNNMKSYDKLGGIATDARLAGLLDWEGIVDETRYIRKRPFWDDPGEILRSATSSFKLDRWDNQDFRIEVWIEKDALLGSIKQICHELDVPYFACRGYVSQSEMWAAAERLSWYKEQGQQPIIIHLGDHDPSGIDMTRDILARHTTFGSGIEIERIALNMDQVKQYNPPPNPAKLKDSRAKDYVRKFGRSSWELDALDPRILSQLIEDAVENYRDPDRYEDMMAREAEFKKTLSYIDKNWEKLGE